MLTGFINRWQAFGVAEIGIRSQLSHDPLHSSRSERFRVEAAPVGAGSGSSPKKDGSPSV